MKSLSIIAVLGAGLTTSLVPATAQIDGGADPAQGAGPAVPGAAAVELDQPTFDQATFDDGFVAFIEGDFAQAKAIWRPLALAGDIEAQRGLGIMYRDGYGAEPDGAMAAAWFTRAATAGDAESQIYLAQYLGAEGAQKDAAAAADWARRAADQGAAQAQFMLGQMYQAGDGVTIDPIRAAIWYERAAASGWAEAQLQLGLMFRDGLGIRANGDRAAELLAAAAAQGLRAPPPRIRIGTPVRLSREPSVGGRADDTPAVDDAVGGFIQVEPLGPLPLADTDKFAGLLDDPAAILDSTRAAAPELEAEEFDGPLTDAVEAFIAGAAPAPGGAAVTVDRATAAAPTADESGAADKADEPLVDLAAAPAGQPDDGRADGGGADGGRAVVHPAERSARDLGDGGDGGDGDEPEQPTPADGGTDFASLSAPDGGAAALRGAADAAPAAEENAPAGTPVLSRDRVPTPRVPPVAVRLAGARANGLLDAGVDGGSATSAEAFPVELAAFAQGLAAFAAGDPDAARAQWEPLANLGDGDPQSGLAHLGLGWLSEVGDGGEPDFAAAAAHYQAASALDLAEGHYRLARLLEDGRGVAPDPRRAERLRRQAIDTALDREPVELTATPGVLLEVQPDTSNWLTRTLGKFSRRGSALGRAYLLFRQGMDQDAVAIWRDLAQRDVAAAQFGLARALDLGRGVDADPAAALTWLRQAADAGYGPAMHNLGVRLAEGRGIDADRQQAVEWFARAAEDNIAAAQHMLGLAYINDTINGTEVPENPQRARRLLEAALAGGIAEARLGLAALDLQGNREGADPMVGLGHLETAARSGSTVAQAALGLLLTRDGAVEHNMALAQAWLERAAQGGDLDAQYNLGVLGVFGSPEDVDTGYQWLSRAAAGGLARAQDLRAVVEQRLPGATVAQAQ